MNDESPQSVQPEGTPVAPGGASAPPKEVACKTCSEMVPIKSLRCWNCGSYMRDDIAQKAQQMRQAPPQIIYSELPPDTEAEDPEEAYSLDVADETYDDAEEDDFELSPEISAFEEAEDESASETPSNGQTVAEAPPEAASEDAGQAETEAGDDTGADEQAAESQSPSEPDESHSVATGGDVLLDLGLSEEKESQKRRMERAKIRAEKRRIARPGFTWVFCPHGHRMEVPETNRGRWGKCPKCREPFHVPVAAWRDPALQDEQASEAEAAEAGKPEEAEVAAGKFTRWLSDARWHLVNPEKLKLKAGSLVDDFELRDLGFSPEQMLAVVLLKKGGFFGSVDEKKKTEAREAMFAHLQDDKPLEKLAVASQESFDLEAIEKMRVVSPVPEGDEPMFMGVPVFGEGKIWIRVPSDKGGTEVQLVSLFLSEFRRLARIAEELYGMGNLPEGINVPLTDEFTELQCHYSDEKLHILEDVTYHQPDPVIKLQLAGRKCQECGLVVSEDSRKKEKIGGSSGKGIAKAKCPKCEQKFGDISLFTIEGYQPPEEDAAGEEDG